MNQQHIQQQQQQTEFQEFSSENLEKSSECQENTESPCEMDKNGGFQCPDCQKVYNLPDLEIAEMKLFKIREFLMKCCHMKPRGISFSDNGLAAWSEWTEDVTEKQCKQCTTDALITQTLTLSKIFSILDCNEQIDALHVQSALEIISD